MVFFRASFISSILVFGALCCRQGLLKDEGKAKFGDAFRTWQKQADTFAIDGHAPVRELWYRASVAWQEILNPEQVRLRACVISNHVVVKSSRYFEHTDMLALSWSASRVDPFQTA